MSKTLRKLRIGIEWFSFNDSTMAIHVKYILLGSVVNNRKSLNYVTLVNSGIQKKRLKMPGKEFMH